MLEYTVPLALAAGFIGYCVAWLSRFSARRALRKEFRTAKDEIGLIQMRIEAAFMLIASLFLALFVWLIGAVARVVIGAIMVASKCHPEMITVILTVSFCIVLGTCVGVACFVTRIMFKPRMK